MSLHVRLACEDEHFEWGFSRIQSSLLCFLLHSIRTRVESNECRCFCRRLDSSNRFSDRLCLLLHQFLGEIWLILLEVVSKLIQFRYDHLRMGSVAEKDLHELRRSQLALPRVLLPCITYTCLNAFFDVVLGKKAKPFHPYTVSKHLTTRRGFGDRLINGGQQGLDVSG